MTGPVLNFSLRCKKCGVTRATTNTQFATPLEFLADAVANNWTAPIDGANRDVYCPDHKP